MTPPDLRKLSRAVIALALADAEAEKVTDETVANPVVGDERVGNREANDD